MLRYKFENQTEAARLIPDLSPSKIVCVGRNYVEHAKEMGNEVPTEPLLFLKPPSALIGAGDAIVSPRLSQRVDFEGELGVIIGRTARRVKRAAAMEYVLGYTCVNDVTARDIQKKDGQWTRGKGFDTFCAVGPKLVLRDALELAGLRVRTLLNGAVKQDAPLSDLIFPIDFVIEYITQFLTLEPGDLIATGTPPGVGPMAIGDVVRVEIDGIGALENTVEAEP